MQSLTEGISGLCLVDASPEEVDDLVPPGFARDAQQGQQRERLAPTEAGGRQAILILERMGAKKPEMEQDVAVPKMLKYNNLTAVTDQRVSVTMPSDGSERKERRCLFKC